jgi:hypothetical protein
MRAGKVSSVMTAVVLLASLAGAQDRMLSPRGQASTQVGGSFDAEGKYDGGKWIDVDYGRPILRGRDNIWGSGDDYGQGLLLGQPLWRVGANQTTTFTTEVDLMFGGNRLPAGTYTVFAEALNNREWTLIFATWGVKQGFREENDNALWGAYGYNDSKDVLRTSMPVDQMNRSADELIIAFTNMTQQGGDFTVWWDDQMGAAAFSVAN